MDLTDKILSGKATLGDQEEACKDPYLAYHFAHNIKGADLEKCQESACKVPSSAYRFAHNIKGANIFKCQAAACKDPGYAYLFARNVKGADIEKCQEAACKDPKYAYDFALDVKGADIEKCQEAACPKIKGHIWEGYKPYKAKCKLCGFTMLYSNRSRMWAPYDWKSEYFEIVRKPFFKAIFSDNNFEYKIKPCSEIQMHEALK